MRYINYIINSSAIHVNFKYMSDRSGKGNCDQSSLPSSDVNISSEAHGIPPLARGHNTHYDVSLLI